MHLELLCAASCAAELAGAWWCLCCAVQCAAGSWRMLQRTGRRRGPSEDRSCAACLAVSAAALVMSCAGAADRWPSSALMPWHAGCPCCRPVSSTAAAPHGLPGGGAGGARQARGQGVQRQARGEARLLLRHLAAAHDGSLDAAKQLSALTCCCGVTCCSRLCTSQHA